MQLRTQWIYESDITQNIIIFKQRKPQYEIKTLHHSYQYSYPEPDLGQIQILRLNIKKGFSLIKDQSS